jgi:hypothetical protein
VTRLGVSAAGLVGLALVARAALAYRGVDPLAFGLVLLIAVGLVLGLAELFARARRMEELERALAALPSDADLERVRACPAPLRALLEARLAGAPGTPPGAVFAPYLLGLLVMIGLLGTFMGLFETLRGAREALGASGDVMALREGLAAPMTGLSRAFGTSAAGVSASAMLGLASVFVRRAETRFSTALAGRLAGSLFPLTLAGRQLTALEALAADRHALPRAARAMERATSRLEALERELVAGQKAAAEETARASKEASLASVAAAKEASLASVAAAKEATAESVRAIEAATREALSLARESHAASSEASRAAAEGLTRTMKELSDASIESARKATSDLAEATRSAGAEAAQAALDAARSIRGDLRAGIEEASKAVAPVVDEAVRRAAAAAGEEIGAWSELVRAESDARRESDRAHREALALSTERGIEEQRALEQARLRHLSTELERLSESVGERLEKLAAREEAMSALVEARLAEVATALGARLRDTADQTSAALARVVTSVESSEARADRRDEERLLAVERLSGEIARRAEASAQAVLDHAAVARDADRAREAKTAEVLASLDQKLTSHLATLGERLAGPLADAARAATTGPEAVARLVEAEGERIASRARADAERDARIDALLQKIGELGEALGRRAESDSERMLALDEKLAADREAAARLFSEKLAAHAEGVGQSLRETADLVRDAVGLVHAGGTEMSAVAEMFTSAVDRYSRASERWLDSLSTLETAFDKKSGHDDAADLLGAYLDQTREVFDHSLAFQKELFSELRALRAKRAD